MTRVLRGITWEHERGLGSVVAAAEAYRAVRPDIEVRWEHRSLQAFADQPLTQLAERVDLLVIDHPHVPSAAERGLIAPLDGCGFDAELARLAANTVGRSHESYCYNGRQWGLATDAAAQVAAYRPDLLPVPPHDWDSVLALARDGRVLWPGKPIDAYSSLLSIAASHGSPALREPTVFLSADAMATAMRPLRELAGLVPADNLDLNPIEVAERLATSDRWLYSPLLFGYSNYSRADYRPARLAYIDAPMVTDGRAISLLGGAGITVSASSANREESIAHAFWLASDDVQRGVYYDGGGQPGNAAAWDDDRVNDDSLDFFTGTRKTLDSASLRPRHPRYIDFQDAASPLVTLALRGDLGDDRLAARMNVLAAEIFGDTDEDD